MKKIIVVILITLSVGCNFALLSKLNESKVEIAERTKVISAYDDALHYFYSNSEDWMNFRESKEYKALDSLKEGDWEDFFYY